MKKLFLILSCLIPLISFNLKEDKSKEIIGAWTIQTEMNGKEVTGTSIFTDGYFATTYYSIPDKEFLLTLGGKWSMSGSNLTLELEFNSANKSVVGDVQTNEITVKGNKLTGGDQTWTRIDNGVPGKLEGAWLFTGRERDGVMARSTPGERKTMKILSGTRFQWIAYHTGTGEFFGTGGGTYSTKEGKYTENIEFFSRDSNRIGDSLTFDYEIQGEDWHHKGKSSKGDPMYEIWTRRTDQ